MLLFYLINGLLIALFTLSLYSYVKIDEITINSETSKKILLSSFIISSIFLIISDFLYAANFFSLNRTKIFMSTAAVISSILLMISYNYLNKEMKSPSGYDTILNNLKEVELNTNRKEKNISLIGGIVGLSVIGAVLFILFGQMFYSKEKIKIVTVKEPVYIEREDEKPKYIKLE